MSLYKKIYDVMCDTEALEKNMTVGSGNSSYKAISEKEVLNMVKPLLKKHGLILVPINAAMTESVDTYDTQRGRTTRCISSLVETWRVIDIDTGESIDAVGVGNGADPQDKGPGKASTYAYKNMLSKMFMLFSGEDTDNTHSDDISAQMTAKKVTKDQSDELQYLVIETNTDYERFCKYWKVKDTIEMTVSQYEEAKKLLEAKKRKK